MNMGRFHAAVTALIAEFDSIGTIGHLQSVEAALQASISQPSEETAIEFKKKYKNILDVLAESGSNFEAPTRRMIYAEIRAIDNIGLVLSNRIKESFSSNNVTPSSALAELIKIREGVVEFYSNISVLEGQLNDLDIEYDELEAGEFEIGISIPKDMFSSGIDELGKELKLINELSRTFSEVAGEDTTSTTLKTISSSEWQIFLDSMPATALLLATAVERIVALYKNHLEIRKLKAEMENKELPDKIIEEMKKFVSSQVKKELKSISNDLVDEYYVNNDDGRKHEMKTAMSISLKYLASRIDNGSTIEVRGKKGEQPKEPKKPSKPDGIEDSDELRINYEKSLEDYNKLMEEYGANLVKFEEISGIVDAVDRTNESISLLEREDSPLLMLELSDEEENADGEEKSGIKLKGSKKKEPKGSKNN